MIRFIVLAVVIALIYQVLRRSTQRLQGRRPEQVKDETETMQQCVVCELHVPADETLQRDGHTFCSQEHLLQWQHEHRR